VTLGVLSNLFFRLEFKKFNFLGYSWNWTIRTKLWGAAGMLEGVQEILLTPGEVASLFRVDPKTVTRWAKAGKLTSIRTLGGHRRYKDSEVKALLNSVSGANNSNGGN
jgi:excisionase family DNA binding protein